MILSIIIIYYNTRSDEDTILIAIQSDKSTTELTSLEYIVHPIASLAYLPIYILKFSSPLFKKNQTRTGLCKSLFNRV